MPPSSTPWALLGLASLTALAVAARAPTRGSRGSRQDPGVLVGTTRAKVNEAAMWTLAAEKLYGSYVDVPVVATREALQNSRDAIQKAIRSRKLAAKDAEFRVTWDPASRTLSWADNGIGMTREVVSEKFLSLGDTTKIATAQRNELQAGGFGLAKAILLGASKTFTWTLETLDHRFVAQGFDHPIEIRRAASRPGVTLSVSDVSPKHDWGYVGDSRQNIPQRIHALLATCDTSFPLYLNDIRVTSAFSGRGTVVEKGASWGRGTTGEVRVYKRSQPGGRFYVRLFGLTQFSRDLAGGKADFDVVVDLQTTIAPTEDGYPLTASRMELSGPSQTTLNRLIQQFGVDVLSSIKGDGPELVGSETVDSQAKAKAEAYADALLASVSADPELTRMLAGLGVSGTTIRNVFAQAERQQAVDKNPSTSSAGESAKAFLHLAESGIADESPPPAPQVKPAERRSTGAQNPFAGVGLLKVNAAQWTKRRLAPYLKNPVALLPLLVLWRLAVHLVYTETSGRAPSFTVGFLFDDTIRAEYDAKHNRLFSLNPVAVLKLVQALPDNPAVVAAYLHNKACHEVTHAQGLSDHDERFVSHREHNADLSAAVLAPLTFLTAKLLGMGGLAPTAAPRAPRKVPVPKVPMKRSEYDSHRFEIVEQPHGSKGESPLVKFGRSVVAAVTEAGYPTEMNVDQNPNENFKVVLYVSGFNVAENWRDSMTLTLYRDDSIVRGRDDLVRWGEVLSAQDRASIASGGVKELPLATRYLAFLLKVFAEQKFVPPKGDANRMERRPKSRRALLAQAEAILRLAP